MSTTSEMLPDAIVTLLKEVLHSGQSAVPLHAPLFEGREWDYVKNCLDSTWVSSVGRFVDRFEGILQDITGVRHAVAVVNGTCALHMALMLAGVKPGDEVLVPTLTFVATANAVSHAGATPHFVDSEEHTLGIDAAKLEQHLAAVAEPTARGCRHKATGKTIRAIVPMHAFGHPVDLDALAEVCGKWGLVMVEDAAEALGSLYKGRHVGGYGSLSVLSFNGNKIATCGGGGAILTNDEALARKARHLTTTAKRPHTWCFSHDAVGYNYRLPNLNAALGCAQLERLPSFVERKRALARRYTAAFESLEGVSIFAEPEFARSNFWLNTLLLDEGNTLLRDETLKLANQAGIGARPAWALLHRLPMYTECPRADLAMAETLERRIINLPSGAGL